MQDEKDMKYRGDPDRVHIADGERVETGAHIARSLEFVVRYESAKRDSDGVNSKAWDMPLCPGCYMVAMFNACTALARANGQTMSELGNSMSAQFAALAAGGPEEIEEIVVIRDADEVQS